VLDCSEQGYYQWRRRRQKIEQREAVVLAAVKALRKQLPRLGARKLQHCLARWQIQLGRDQLFDILRRNQLLARPKRRSYCTTQGAATPVFPDLSFTPTAPNQLWVADITYLRLQQRFRFLALITDAYSRYIVGYYLGSNLSSETTLAALRQALAGHYVPPGLVHHSDRGIQYVSHSYLLSLRQVGIRSSVTQHGSPYENAQAERVNGILKHEFHLATVFQTEEQLTQQVHYAIFAYNCLRPHFACNLNTPLNHHFSTNPP
jgi:putative transposase